MTRPWAEWLKTCMRWTAVACLIGLSAVVFSVLFDLLVWIAQVYGEWAVLAIVAITTLLGIAIGAALRTGLIRLPSWWIRKLGL